ncbi:MAG TPA: glycosyltransferase family 61 protein [Bacteroidales bacterium]|nr:glycosyltransferase family 61 protein [Bacteroidales bacterium]
MKSAIHINYKLPENFQTGWSHLFRSDYKYKSVDLKVRELSNVFVNHYGLVIKNGLLVQGCAPNTGFSNYDNGYYFKHWRKATEQMLVCRYGKSLTSLRLDDNKRYLLIHSPWFSYYFWLTECLPRLLMVKNELKDLVLIYPENWKYCAYVNDTLELFPELDKCLIPADTHLFVKNLVMPEVKPWTPMVIPEQVFEVREFIVSEAKKRMNFGHQHKNVYISRNDAKYKKIANEEDFIELAAKYNYEVHTMSGKSVFEQAALMQSTQNLISITGASMANYVFLNADSAALDLTNKMYINDKKYKFHFKKILDCLNAKYYVQFCDPVIDKQLPSVAMYDIKVDLSACESILIRMAAPRNSDRLICDQ